MPPAAAMSPGSWPRPPPSAGTTCCSWMSPPLRRAPTSGRPGLLDVLRGESSFANAVDFGRVGDISLMERGRLHGTQRGGSRGSAARFLADAGRDFDVVIVDAGDIARTVAIGTLMGAVDHVLLVAELTGTRQNEAATLAETAAVMGGDITATILVEPRGRA